MIPTATPDQLTAGTRMAAVELLVRDLPLMRSFYTDGVGLEVLQESGSRLVLGSGGRVIMTLIAQDDLPPVDPRAAGLYHTAFLYENAADLAAALARTATWTTRAGRGRFTGSADHLVSEAFYLDDPENNGVELYLDRPREAWSWDAQGRVAMASLFLDPNQYLADHLPAGAGHATGTVLDGSLGHVHLQVGDIATARSFYVDALGFAETAGLGDSALFVSAGGYHHHIGMNTWRSAGAPARAASLGLGDVRIQVPDADEVSTVRARLRDRGLQIAGDDDEITVLDPWGTRVVVTAGSR